VEKRRLALTDDCGELGARKVWADRVLVRQVVLNLLTNAVKFNREGGSVAVSCQPLAGSYPAHRCRRHRRRDCQVDASASCSNPSRAWVCNRAACMAPALGW
jgi:signal transduction histidine kinase